MAPDPQSSAGHERRDPATPRVLLIDTSLAGNTEPAPLWQEVINYSAVSDVARWVRSGEQLLRIDFSLARRAVSRAREFDLLFAGSEKVGIPLALCRPPRPVICLVHQIASPAKRRLLAALRIPSRWARIAYQCEADRRVLLSFDGVSPDRLFCVNAAPLDTFSVTGVAEGAYVLSMGTSKRDYATLLDALDGLPGVTSHLYVSSRYKDPYKGSLPDAARPWIVFKEPVAPPAVPSIYASARFVVVPIRETYQHSAGMTVVFEALSAGKAIVATRSGGMPDYVIDGVNGFLVPVGDVAAMRQAIARLWSDPRLAADMGRAGRALAEKELHPARVESVIRQAYAEACREFRCRQ